MLFTLKTTINNLNEMPNYVRINLQTVNEARTLALVVATCTVRYLTAPNLFVKILSPNQIMKVFF